MTTVMEKPLTFHDYKTIKLTSDQKAASYIIRQLNERIKMKQTAITSWSKEPERVEVIAIVAQAFRMAGWQGVIQRKNKEADNYGIHLIPPECDCTGREECEKCKEGPF